MKRVRQLICLTLVSSALITAMTSCRQPDDTAGTTAPVADGYTYYPSSFEEYSTAFEETSAASGGEETSPSQAQTQENVSAPHTEQQTTRKNGEQQTNKTPSAPTTSPQKTPEKTTASQENTNVDLSIEVPSANGQMEVDTSRGNKFTVIVSEERKIDPSYLIAVYSVPDSGQNYVFEFTSKTSRTENDLRRVYLIDKNGKITGVAAKNANEKENVSAIENWFCMNVLIKKMIFPAVKDEF